MSDDGDMLVKVLARVLERLIDINVKSNSSNNRNQEVTKFHSSYAPDVSILSYLERIKKYAKCHDSCFIVSLIYIDRLIEMQSFLLSPLNIHRLLITCVMVAAKFFEDDFFKNTYYAKLGGVPGWEINCLEIELLRLLNFSLYVKSDVYAKYHSELRNYVGFIEVSPSTSLTIENSPTNGGGGGNSSDIFLANGSSPNPQPMSNNTSSTDTSSSSSFSSSSSSSSSSSTTTTNPLLSTTQVTHSHATDSQVYMHQKPSSADGSTFTQPFNYLSNTVADTLENSANQGTDLTIDGPMYSLSPYVYRDSGNEEAAYTGSYQPQLIMPSYSGDLQDCGGMIRQEYNFDIGFVVSPDSSSEFRSSAELTSSLDSIHQGGPSPRGVALPQWCGHVDTSLNGCPESYDIPSPSVSVHNSTNNSFFPHSTSVSKEPIAASQLQQQDYAWAMARPPAIIPDERNLSMQCTSSSNRYFHPQQNSIPLHQLQDTRYNPMDKSLWYLHRQQQHHYHQQQQQQQRYLLQQQQRQLNQHYEQPQYHKSHIAANSSVQPHLAVLPNDKKSTVVAAPLVHQHMQTQQLPFQQNACEGMVGMDGSRRTSSPSGLSKQQPYQNRQIQPSQVPYSSSGNVYYQHPLPAYQQPQSHHHLQQNLLPQRHHPQQTRSHYQRQHNQQSTKIGGIYNLRMEQNPLNILYAADPCVF